MRPDVPPADQGVGLGVEVQARDGEGPHGRVVEPVARPVDDVGGDAEHDVVEGEEEADEEVAEQRAEVLRDRVAAQETFAECAERERGGGC